DADRGIYAGLSVVAEDFVEDLGRVGGRVGLDAEAFHGRGVIVDVVALVQVEGAGELLDVDDVGEVLVGEAQDGEGAAGRCVAAGVEGDDLEAHVGQLGGLDERLDLAPDDGRAADRAAQRG